MSNRFITTTRPTTVKTRGKVENDNKVTVIILGAMPVYRMRVYGPTPLIEYKDKTLFQHISDEVDKAFPNNEKILTVGFQANKVIKNIPRNIRIVENPFFEETNLVEELRLAINNSVKERLLIINCNCLINYESLTEIKLSESSIIIENKGLIDKNSVGVVVNKSKVDNFAYGIDNKWCEIFYLVEKEIDILQNIISHPDRKKLFMFEALNMMLNKSGQLVAIEPKNIDFKKVESCSI